MSASAPPGAPAQAKTGARVAADETLSARISALEADRARELASARPWYRQASVLIAALALVFSVTATWLGEQRASERDASSARVELSQLIQRLSSLPREATELQARYADDPATSNNLSGMIQTENSVLAHQASDIIDRIPDRVSGMEYLAVGQALRFSGDFGLAETLFDTGLGKDNDSSATAALWRAKGELDFDMGRLSPARAAMAKAIEAYSGQQASIASAADVSTEWMWASYEQLLGACDQVGIHLDRAQQYLDQLPMSTFKIQMMASLMSVRTRSTSACPSQ